MSLCHDSASVNSVCGAATVSMFCSLSVSFVFVFILVSHVCRQYSENCACSKCHMITFYSILIARSGFMSNYLRIKQFNWSGLSPRIHVTLKSAGRWFGTHDYI